MQRHGLLRRVESVATVSWANSPAPDSSVPTMSARPLARGEDKKVDMERESP